MSESVNNQPEEKEDKLSKFVQEHSEEIGKIIIAIANNIENLPQQSAKLKMRSMLAVFGMLRGDHYCSVHP